MYSHQQQVDIIKVDFGHQLGLLEEKKSTLCPVIFFFKFSKARNVERTTRTLESGVANEMKSLKYQEVLEQCRMQNWKKIVVYQQKLATKCLQQNYYAKL